MNWKTRFVRQSTGEAVAKSEVRGVGCYISDLE